MSHVSRTTEAASSLERLLWLLALACTASICCSGIQGYAARQQAERIVRHAVDPRSGTAAEIAAPQVSSVIGRLEIPALQLAVPVLSDFDPASLRRGVGHIQGTAMPGGLGTLGLAGHRDTFFRPLQHVSKNMDIRVTDQTGTYHYQVDSTEIVTPDQVQVLDIADQPKLTLITCYPFDYIGQAPKRFIVHAHLLSLDPDLRPRT